jgi:hypothetical protein
MVNTDNSTEEEIKQRRGDLKLINRGKELK